MRIVPLVAALLIAVNATGQVPPGPRMATDPTALPGDNLPPAAGMHGPPPGGGGGKPPPEAGSDAPSPSLAIAVAAAQGAIDACLADGYKVSASVIDSAGMPRATLTADGAVGSHAYMGVRKALTAVAFGRPTSEVSAELSSDAAARARIRPNMAPMPGAVPLKMRGVLVGAIGVSGASGLQDEKCAVAGVAKVRARLDS